MNDVDTGQYESNSGPLPLQKSNLIDRLQDQLQGHFQCAGGGNFKL
jgi:hypothetical protein